MHNFKHHARIKSQKTQYHAFKYELHFKSCFRFSTSKADADFQTLEKKFIIEEI